MGDRERCGWFVSGLLHAGGILQANAKHLLAGARASSTLDDAPVACRHAPFPGLTDHKPVAQIAAVSGLGEATASLAATKRGCMISYRAVLSCVSMHDESPRRCFHDCRVQVALLSS